VEDGQPGEASERILQFIQNNPGCHLRKIKGMIGISQGTVQYHTDRLEKMGKITSTRSGLYKHYFPIGVFQNNEKEILQVLSQETARRILMFIVEQQRAPAQTDIVNSIGISASSVNWHIKRLIEFRLVKEIKEGKYRRYQLEDRRVSKYITALMRNYYPAIWEKWSDRLIEIFLSMSGSETK
jgi:predicted transcriptional regulator